MYMASFVYEKCMAMQKGQKLFGRLFKSRVIIQLIKRYNYMWHVLRISVREGT
jgi:hypothetical protein